MADLADLGRPQLSAGLPRIAVLIPPLMADGRPCARLAAPLRDPVFLISRSRLLLRHSPDPDHRPNPSRKMYARAYGGGGEVCQVCHRLWKRDGRPILVWQTCRIARSAKVCQVCRRRPRAATTGAVLSSRPLVMLPVTRVEGAARLPPSSYYQDFTTSCHPVYQKVR